MGFLGVLFFFGHDQEAYQPQKSLLLGAEVGDIEPQEIFILRVLHAVKVDTQRHDMLSLKTIFQSLKCYGVSFIEVSQFIVALRTAGNKCLIKISLRIITK